MKKVIDFIRHKKKIKGDNLIKLQGILKDYDIYFSDLEGFKQKTWLNVVKELNNE